MVVDGACHGVDALGDWSNDNIRYAVGHQASYRSLAVIQCGFRDPR